jgi:hypothetical protein
MKDEAYGPAKLITEQPINYDGEMDHNHLKQK